MKMQCCRCLWAHPIVYVGWNLFTDDESIFTDDESRFQGCTVELPILPSGLGFFS